MPIVYGVNPTKPRKHKSKGGRKAVRNMENPKKKRGGGKKKKRGKRTYTKTVTKWRTRNPAKRGRIHAKARARRGFAALDIGHAIRGSVALVGGMIIAKAAVNKITTGGSETALWSWPNIATAALSSFLAAFLIGAVFHVNINVTRYIFMGGLALALYKAFTTKLAPKWGWTNTWFGADEDINPALLGAGGEIDIYEPIKDIGADTYEVVDGYGQNEYGQTNQMLQEMGFAGQLNPYNPAMGELSPYNPSMGATYSPYPPSVTQAAKSLVHASGAYPGSY